MRLLDTLVVLGALVTVAWVGAGGSGNVPSVGAVAGGGKGIGPGVVGAVAPVCVAMPPPGA